MKRGGGLVHPGIANTLTKESQSHSKESRGRIRTDLFGKHKKGGDSKEGGEASVVKEDIGRKGFFN